MEWYFIILIILGALAFFDVIALFSACALAGKTDKFFEEKELLERFNAKQNSENNF